MRCFKFFLAGLFGLAALPAAVEVAAEIAAEADGRAGALPCTLEAPCEVGEGHYALRFPAEWDGTSPLRAMIFYHGHNSSMKSTIRAAGLRRDFVADGGLLIAPNGAQSASGVRRWPARMNASWRDDAAFTLAVLDDVEARVPLEGKPVVSGFSAGGSMAWMMACLHGDRFSALVSVAGALRRPHPETCPSPVSRVLHIHGFSDNTVPLEGRGIGAWHQGGVAESFALWLRSRSCRSNPDDIGVDEGWRRRDWLRCGLTYLEHDGGHGLPKGWTGRARAWFDDGDAARTR